MKKILFSAIAIIIAITATAQNRVMKVYKNGEIAYSSSVSDVDSIKIENVGTSTDTPSTGTNVNGHEYVDLGLPSGLKWATCNVGATNPEDYGDYYAWGEITTKEEYTSFTSVTYGMELGDFSGNATYDAARANWGGSWRMPTDEELTELRNECTWLWGSQNGVKGYKVKGKNGNWIFLPVAGYRYGSSLDCAGAYGYYWSSTPNESGTSYAYSLYFFSSYCGRYSSHDRTVGRSVRPVTE